MRDSVINPRNWFGRSKSEAVSSGPVNPLIPQRGGVFSRKPEAEFVGLPVATVSQLRVERVADGAIVHVKGVTDTQGWHDIRLIKDENASKKGTLTFSLRGLRSPHRELIGPTQSREVVAATSLTQNDLVGVRTIRVVGAKNARSTRRR